METVSSGFVLVALIGGQGACYDTAAVPAHALVSHLVSVNILLIGVVSQYRARMHDFLYICTNDALFSRIVQKI